MHKMTTCMLNTISYVSARHVAFLAGSVKNHNRGTVLKNAINCTWLLVCYTKTCQWMEMHTLYVTLCTEKHCMWRNYIHPLNGPLSRTTQVSHTRKVKPIWILLEQETVGGSGIRWAVCKSAPRSRQLTTPAPTTQFLQAGCPSCRPTNSVKALKAFRNACEETTQK